MKIRKNQNLDAWAKIENDAPRSKVSKDLEKKTKGLSDPKQVLLRELRDLKDYYNNRAPTPADRERVQLLIAKLEDELDKL